MKVLCADTAMQVEEFPQGYLQRTCNVILQLHTAIERLQSRQLMPYNATALLARLMQTLQTLVSHGCEVSLADSDNDEDDEAQHQALPIFTRFHYS